MTHDILIMARDCNVDFITRTYTANGRRTDATQEMIALGLGTLLGSFFGSMPISASFGRSSVQAASGAKTPLTNIYGGTLLFSYSRVFDQQLLIFIRFDNL